MKSKKWLCALLVALMALSSSVALAQGRGHGHGEGRGEDREEGRGHGKEKHKEKDRRAYRYSRHDRDEMMAWYHGYRGDLPPGLAKKDRLPPGLERQLRVRGTLPPGLRGYVQPCPVGLVRLLPPPPPDYEHVAIGGHIVLMNRQTYMVLDIFKMF